MAQQQPRQDDDFRGFAASGEPLRADRAGIRLYLPDAELRDGPGCSLADLVDRYGSAKKLKKTTLAEYWVTVRAWDRWQATNHRCMRPMHPSEITTAQLETFLNWAENESRQAGAKNPENVRNKHRRHLRAILAHGLKNDAPEVPATVSQRRVGSRHWFRDEEIDSLYAAAGSIEDPPGWDWPCSRALVWQTAIVLWTNLGMDTGLLFPRDATQRSTALRVKSFQDVRRDPFGSDTAMPYGVLVYDRPKTGYEFTVPINEPMRRHIVAAIAGDIDNSDRLLLKGGCGGHACKFFQDHIVSKSSIHAKLDRKRGREQWLIKDFRNTAGQRAMAFGGLETARAVLGHKPANVTEQHYVEPLPLLARYFLGDGDRAPVSQPKSFSLA